jgi:hypothetical protein
MKTLLAALILLNIFEGLALWLQHRKTDRMRRWYEPWRYE